MSYEDANAGLSFNTPVYMQYQKPDVSIEEGPDQFTIIRSQAGNTNYHPNEVIRIHLSSTDKFIRPNKCFVTFKVQLTKGGSALTNAPTGLTTSWAGVPGGSFFRIRTSCLGREIEDVQHYGAYLGAVYAKLPQEAVNVLSATEATNNQSDMLSNWFAAGRYYAHAPKTAVFESSRLLPIPFMRSLDVEFIVGQLGQLIATQANVQAYQPDSFTISDFAFHACWVPVSQAYLSEFYTGIMEHNKEAIVPIKKTTVIPVNIANPAANMTQIYALGQLDSLASATFLIRDGSVFQPTTSSAQYQSATAYNTTGLTTILDGDETRNSNSTRVAEWWLTADGKRFPSDMNVGLPASMDAGGTLLRVSDICYNLASVDMNYAGINVPVSATPIAQNSVPFFEDTYRDGILHWSWEPTAISFGQGLKLSDSLLQLNTNVCNGGYNANTRCDGFFVYDTHLVIRKEGVDVVSAGFRT